MSSVVPAVAAGLVAGSVFIAAFAVQYYPPSYTVLFDRVWQSNIPHGSEILKIIENNATISDHNKNRYLTVFHISERHEAGENCPFGSCARVLINTQSGFMHIYVNYEKGFVAGCFEQRFSTIYYAIFNCAGERIGGVRQSMN